MIKNNILIILLIIFLSISNLASAQQTVFNVPSADVTEKGHTFLQQEAQFRAWQPGAFFLGTSYSSYGIGHNTEIDATLFNVGAPATNSITLGTGFKSAIPIAGLKDKYPKREYKFTVGSQVLSSLEGQGVGNWTYGHLSGRVPKTNTRLTGGVSYGTKQVFGTNQAVFISAVEQPITKRLNLISDWYSGNEHFSGFLITGISYAYKNNKTLYAGYQIPNSSKVGKSGFVIEFAKIF
jgi:hypothetical protein